LVLQAETAASIALANLVKLCLSYIGCRWCGI